MRCQRITAAIAAIAALSAASSAFAQPVVTATPVQPATDASAPQESAVSAGASTSAASTPAGAMDGGVGSAPTARDGGAETPVTNRGGTGGTAVLPSGATVVFGLGIPLLRLGALRPPDQLARARDYRFDVGVVTPGLLFHAIVNPADSFSRRGNLQIVSVGAFLLGQFNTQRSAQSELALGASMYLLNATIGIGIAVDLYRGVPVMGPNGAGTETAQTGLLSALMLPNGEFTVENLVFTFDVNLVAIGQALTGGRPPSVAAPNANSSSNGSSATNGGSNAN